MNDTSPKDFESTINALEEVVNRLEEGGLTLEEQLAEYEKGVGLAAQCQEMLENAKLRLVRLLDEVEEESEIDEDDDDEESPF